MSPTDPNVAIYIDFDNVALSRYDELHGRQAFKTDRAGGRNPTPIVHQRLVEARLDIGALMDYAASVGPVSISRAYADWSNPMSASYAQDMMRHAIDLVQLFPLTGTKNGADIRLAIDTVDDLSRHPHVGTVIVVAGDSDYVALAQRCKRLGRKVVGVGVRGSVGRHWETACDEFRYYHSILQVSDSVVLPSTLAPDTAAPQQVVFDSQELLLRAARLTHASSSNDWIHAAALKSLMRRLEPSFDEAQSGFKNFTDFLTGLDKIVEVRRSDSGTLVRLLERTTGAVVQSASDTRSPTEDQLARIRQRIGLAEEVYLTPHIEGLVFKAIQLSWKLCESAPDGGYRGLPLGDLRDALVREGSTVPYANLAAMVALSFHPVLLRDQSMRLIASPELSDLDEAGILRRVRSGIASRVRSDEDLVDASADRMAEAIHGLQVSEIIRDQYKDFCRQTTLQQLARNLRATFMPAPVLWDVAAAFVAVPNDVAINSVQDLWVEIQEFLREVERDLDTVPFHAVYEALRAGGAIRAQGDGDQFSVVAGFETDEVVALVAKAWLEQSKDAHLDAETFFEAILPDRLQADWRDWVRSLMPARESV